MNRKKFLAIAGSVITVGATSFYLSGDKANFKRASENPISSNKLHLNADEREILYLASLAPSGHNTQPWFIKHIEPYHWVVCNDKSKWLAAVDPTQRETILSIGAFIQSLEFAAGNAGYICQYDMLATCNQDEEIVAIKLCKSAGAKAFDIAKIKSRRTVRSNYSNDKLKAEDRNYLFMEETDFLHFIDHGSKEYTYLNEQTIEANRLQAFREDAETELSDWIRFSSKDAERNMDGLTTASMELEGISAWVVRNFFDKKSVMKNSFREQNISTVVKQVSQSAGWVLLHSKDNSVDKLLETGKRMQRLFLEVRRRGIAIHPMTQILEEPSVKNTFNQSIGISENIQFILRMGYMKNYPEPVSLRRPVDWFVKTNQEGK